MQYDVCLFVFVCGVWLTTDFIAKYTIWLNRYVHLTEILLLVMCLRKKKLNNRLCMVCDFCYHLKKHTDTLSNCRLNWATNYFWNNLKKSAAHKPQFKKNYANLSVLERIPKEINLYLFMSERSRIRFYTLIYKRGNVREIPRNRTKNSYFFGINQ